MTSLKAILAFNMKDQRHILGITQAQLAERVNTSTNYIALIETEKRFPTAEMLERIAAALEIDPPALFSTKSYPSPVTGTLAQFQEQVLNDVFEAISVRFRKFEQETPQASDPNGNTGGTIV
jgi:transcriptional regulator with XRE-family HTH domain